MRHGFGAGSWNALHSKLRVPIIYTDHNSDHAHESPSNGENRPRIGLDDPIVPLARSGYEREVMTSCIRLHLFWQFPLRYGIFARREAV